MTIYKKVKNNKTYFYYSTYYKDVYGNSKRKCSKLFETKKACERAEIEFKQEIINDNTLSDITFGLFVEQIYLPQKQKLWKSRSYDKNSRALRYTCKKLWNLQLSKITPLIMNDFYNELLDTHMVSGANDLFTRVSCVFNYAIKYQAIKQNPCHNVEKKRNEKITIDENGNTIDSRLNVWTINEFNQFISFYEGKNDFVSNKYRAFFSTLYFTGMRVGEASALRPSDIDFENQIISITRSFDSTTLKITTPKTNSSIRKIVIPKSLCNLLKDYIESIKHFKHFSNNCFLFSIRTPTYHSTLRTQFHKTIKATNVKPIRMHDLRHSYASNLLSQNYNIAFISKQLGHSNISTTLDVYSTLMSDIEQKEQDRLKNSM